MLNSMLSEALVCTHLVDGLLLHTSLDIVGWLTVIAWYDNMVQAGDGKVCIDSNSEEPEGYERLLFPLRHLETLLPLTSIPYRMINPKSMKHSFPHSFFRQINGIPGHRYLFLMVSKSRGVGRYMTI